MGNSFKISTFVVKLMLFAFVVASFGLSTVNAKEVSEDEKMVRGQLRLSLWYQGLASSETENNTNIQAPSVQVEELARAMERYQSEVEKPYFDARRD
jgi:hypothetical protein